jgi:low temperature requirement protein LtrA
MLVTEVSHAQPRTLAPRPGSARPGCGRPPSRAGARPSRAAVPHRPQARPPGPRKGQPGHRHVVHLGRPTLRTADGHNRDERRASWLELFFDLAFAGAVGQLAGALQSHPTLTTLARFGLLFTPIWWLWVQLTFYADRHESEDATHRASFLVAIGLCIGLAASAPRALSGETTGFVIAFASLRGLQLLLYARARHHLPATRPLYNCYLICFGAGGALWLSSLAVGGAARYALWGVALLADAAGSMAMLVPHRRVPVNPAHLSDRFHLFVLIVLGESMARLISAAASRSWSLSLAVVLAAAVVTLAALWWAWLTAADRKALDGLPAVAQFTALNLPVVAGVAAASAGLHIAILAAAGASTIAAGPRAALYGGVSLFLLASALLPSGKMTRPARVARLATALGALGLVFMGAIVEPVYLVPALTVVLALGLRAEVRPARLGRLPLPWAARPAREMPAGTLRPVTVMARQDPPGGTAETPA